MKERLFGVRHSLVFIPQPGKSEQWMSAGLWEEE
jgi:hypothetical protein